MFAGWRRRLGARSARGRESLIVKGLHTADDRGDGLEQNGTLRAVGKGVENWACQ